MVIVVVLPLPQLLVEQMDVVGDPLLVEQLVELFVVDAMGSLDLAIEVRCPRPDVGMAEVQAFHVPMEL
jgi:hypothetical protein